MSTNFFTYYTNYKVEFNCGISPTTTHLHPVEVSSTGHFKDIFPIDVQTLHFTNERWDGARCASSGWRREGVGVIAYHANMNVPVLQDAVAAHCMVCKKQGIGR